MEVLLKYVFKILITQCQGNSLSTEEELATAMGFQQPSIQKTSFLELSELG